ncbi:MAG: 3-deoxy-7-phosphoheptulonate synthase, partial [Nanoarchaeota archaeon]|nr:3-deoxy-7-phosphoheptulonate synthase [Nanoarchaeota archaeon]
QMDSGLSMPVGLKNSTHGDIGAEVNGVSSARVQHSLPGIDQYGASSQVDTLGNSYTHVVLRGGGGETNYDEASVQEAKRLLGEAKLQQNVVIDCSHDNSQKDHEKQLEVFESIMQQIKDGDKGIVGIMLESNIKGGKQSIPTDLRGFDPSTELKYGKSITDACISWETTEEMIKDASRDLSRSVFTTGI